MTKEEFKKLRIERGYTQMGLGEKTGISWRNIQKIESGDFKLENIRAKNFLALAEALGVEPKELI